MTQIKLVAFDGDDTLWTPLDGVCISDRTPTDDVGRRDFTYHRQVGNPLVIQREDGPRFALRPEVPEVLAELRRDRILIGVVSYNHETNVRRALKEFGVARLFDFVVAEWHTDKGEMLGKMIGLARRDGAAIDAAEVLLVDDDPWDLYGEQCRALGAHFRKFGVDTVDLRELLALVDGLPGT